MSRQKRNVQYVQNEEPAFLKRMKQQAGYKEGPTVDTKRQELENASDSGSENDDEKPQIVVLKAGDLTEEQAKQAEIEAATKPREATDEKVVFKKPVKKDEADEKDSNKHSNKKKSNAKKVKNKSLLSFNDEEEEDT